MITIKFSTIKSDALFLTPTIAVERGISDMAIRFAFWRGVFNVEISKSPKTMA